MYALEEDSTALVVFLSEEHCSPKVNSSSLSVIVSEPMRMASWRRLRIVVRAV